MKNKRIVRSIILLVVGIVWLTLVLIFRDEKEDLTTKLQNADFSLTDNYYIREVQEEDVIYNELLVLEDDEFVRMINEESEVEVYSYNYGNDQFTYLYYFADEMIIKLIYDYNNKEIIEDDSNVFEDMEIEINYFKDYFENILIDYKIKKEEL